MEGDRRGKGTINGISVNELRFGSDNELGRPQVDREGDLADGLKIGVGVEPVDVEPDAVDRVSGDAQDVTDPVYSTSSPLASPPPPPVSGAQGRFEHSATHKRHPRVSCHNLTSSTTHGCDFETSCRPIKLEARLLLKSQRPSPTLRYLPQLSSRHRMTLDCPRHLLHLIVHDFVSRQRPRPSLRFPGV
jgi:hypothetical protein